MNQRHQSRFKTILSAGLYAVTLYLGVTICTLFIAIIVGIYFTINYGIISGIGCGIAGFTVAQIILIMIMDVKFSAIQDPIIHSTIPTDEEVIAELKNELETNPTNKSHHATTRSGGVCDDYS